MTLAFSLLHGGHRSLCAFALQQVQQFVHLLRPSAKVHRIDAEPSAPLELGGGNPEAPALFDALSHVGVKPSGPSWLPAQGYIDIGT
jgi:hypothetical protein